MSLKCFNKNITGQEIVNFVSLFQIGTERAAAGRNSLRATDLSAVRQTELTLRNKLVCHIVIGH